jgi:phage terminase large subunit GpA-like protein
MSAIGQAVGAAKYKTVVAVMGSQMGKTEMVLNIIGHRVDDDPVPILYIAPTKSFVENVFDPRYKAMVNSCDTLLAKRRKGAKEKTTQKEIAGVKVRFAWAGSATELAGDPACLVFVDERDRMAASTEGEGDPVELANARHTTYPDGQTIVISTPTMGTIETKVDPATGLEFWVSADKNKTVTREHGDDDELVQSATWRLFQEGTCYHWAVPCPHCADFFIPRFRLLQWPEGLTPFEIKDAVKMVCPQCGTLIDQQFKDEMNARGVYVAPGQKIDKDGEVHGEAPPSDTASFWVSGLMSAWRTWGDRAQAFVRAVRSGDPDRIQAVINTGFGELYTLKGEAPEVEVVKSLRQPYPSGTLPSDQARRIFLTVDVQKNGLYYVVRAWGPNMESWLIEHGFLTGPTDGELVWKDLLEFKDEHYGGLPIDRCFIDSGYRTQFVYAFCRANRTWAFPTKGRDTIDATPLQKTKLDIAKNSGRRLAGGLMIYHINTDYFKRWVHERIERDPELPGGFHLCEDANDDYCKQLVSEARTVKASGKVIWVRLFKDNHYFDTEVLQVAAAYSLGLQSVRAEPTAARVARRKQATTEAAAEAAVPRRVDPFRQETRRTSGGSGWFK